MRALPRRAVLDTFGPLGDLGPRHTFGPRHLRTKTPSDQDTFEGVFLFAFFGNWALTSSARVDRAPHAQPQLVLATSASSYTPRLILTTSASSYTPQFILTSTSALSAQPQLTHAAICRLSTLLPDAAAAGCLSPPTVPRLAEEQLAATTATKVRTRGTVPPCRGPTECYHLAACPVRRPRQHNAWLPWPNRVCNTPVRRVRPRTLVPRRRTLASLCLARGHTHCRTFCRRRAGNNAVVHAPLMCR
eukprot:scaffold74894_cov34-Phaeocystis_antarctica.AAC.3